MDKSKITIMLDNGHGKETSGKSSPDKRLREWKWAREMVAMINEALTKEGYQVILVTPEDIDISVPERCKRINAVCKENGNNRVLAVSVHVNAAGNGTQWHNANGFLAFICAAASTNSRILAKAISDEAYKMGLKGNRWVPTEGYRTGEFMICTGTRCPAVLTENMFMDNKQDIEFLLSAEGMQMLCDAHVNGIIKYIEQL